MSITISIENGREHAKKHNLVKSEDLGECQCITFGFGDTKPTGKGIPGCYMCNGGTGRMVIENYPLEPSTNTGFMVALWRALNLNPHTEFEGEKEVTGQISGQELLDAFTKHEQKARDLISKQGDEHDLKVLMAIKEVAVEAAKRGEQVFWS